MIGSYLTPKGSELKMSGSRVREIFRVVLDAADIEWIRPDGKAIDVHALRTTYGTCMAAAGTPPAVLKELMGHRDIATTMKHYVHLRAEDARRYVDSTPILPQGEAAKPEGDTGEAAS